MSDLTLHLSAYVDSDPDALLLPVTAAVLRHAWDDARATIGRSDLRLHDLRHTGLTWFATAGATQAELMHRAGHKSSVAAQRYQHATENRDRALAQALANLAPPDSNEKAARDGRAMERTSEHREEGYQR
jgi:integrase